MMKKQLSRLLLCSRSFVFSATVGKFTYIFPKKLSTKIITPIDIAHLQNPFARFAATKFNISPADISRMFKANPTLQRLKTLEKVEQFICMLESNGFKPDQITKIMMLQTSNVTTNVENVLQPKLQLLKESGIEGENMIKVLTGAPRVLSSSLEHEILPKITFLKSTFQTHDLFIKAVLRRPTILTYSLVKSVKPSVAFWEGHGIHGMELARFLCSRPNLLRCCSFTPAQVELIHKIDVDKESKMYRYVLGVVVSLSMESLESKIHNFQLCGLSSEETMELFRTRPLVFCLSTEKVRQTMQFLINDVGLLSNSVVKLTNLLEKNLEKVIKPRFLVLQEIKSSNGLGHFNAKQLSSIVMMPEAKFLSKFVEGHPQSTTLYGVYEKAISNVSSGTKISRKNYFY